MGLSPYLAMTAAEMGACEQLPIQLAYMACHFSPYSTGISNLPEQLPPGSLLILNDRTPICGHDPGLITQQLQQAVETLDCCGVLLDFQRSDVAETELVVSSIVAALQCPVAVSDCYAGDLDCPVFLPPPPLRQPLEGYLQPWQGREVWLEAALGGETAVLTADGCTIIPLELDISEPYFVDEKLCCQYHIDVNPEQFCFHVQRTPPLLDAMLAQAKRLGVTRAVGLYQELYQTNIEALGDSSLCSE